jgi:hypothetical protein
VVTAVDALVRHHVGAHVLLLHGGVLRSVHHLGLLGDAPHVVVVGRIAVVAGIQGDRARRPGCYWDQVLPPPVHGCPRRALTVLELPPP